MTDIKELNDMCLLLNTFFEVRAKLERLDHILDTDRKDESKRNIGGFLVSPMLYYSIYEQIKSEHMVFYKELESKINNYKLNQLKNHGE